MQVSQPIVSLFQSGGGTFAPPLVGATRFTSENGGMTANRLPSTTRFRSENHNQGYTATGYAGSSAPAESLASTSFRIVSTERRHKLSKSGLRSDFTGSTPHAATLWRFPEPRPHSGTKSKSNEDLLITAAITRQPYLLSGGCRLWP